MLSATLLFLLPVREAYGYGPQGHYEEAKLAGEAAGRSQARSGQQSLPQQVRAMAQRCRRA